MSLVNTLMNGGMVGTSINPARYNHDNGALRIATESVEELHDIFMTTFYATEQAELGAVSEGVALEDSSYAAVYEGAVQDAFTKVKEFFKKLWDKVKAWLHNVRRFLDSLFMSGKDFVKKYATDIRKATNLTDFSFKMFKYNNTWLNTGVEIDVDSYVDSLVGEFDGYVKINKDLTLEKAAETEQELEALKKKYSTEYIATDIAKVQGVTAKCEDSSELRQELWSMIRGGATSKDDKDDVDVKDLSTYSNYLEDAVSVKKIDGISKKIDRAYQKAIKFVDDAAKEHSKMPMPEGVSDDAKATLSKQRSCVQKSLSAVSAALSTYQSMENVVMSEWKTAVKERDGVYKQLIIAGLSNHRKNSKKK